MECAYWTDRTAIADYLTKGRTVFAEGTPEADAYLNKEGQAAATLRMRVQSVQLLGTSQPENNGSNQGNVSYAGASAAPVMKSPSASVAMEDDLPF